MKANFHVVLPKVLAHEGGWADHPKDPGGATMKGIILSTYARYKGRKVTKAELRAITDADVAAIYKGEYWDKTSGDNLPSGMDYTVFDASVNSGVGRGPKWLQRALGVKQDAKIGNGTLAAARASDPVKVIKAANAYRMGFLKGLKIWSTFGKGWSRRVAEVEAYSLKLAVGVQAAKAEIIPAAQRQTANKNATAAPIFAGGGSTTLDIPDWALASIGILMLVAAIAFIGNARHHRDRVNALAALTEDT